MERLRNSGFREDMPTLWVDEGTLGYLAKEWHRKVVESLTEISAPGSLFGAGRAITDPDDARYRDLRALVMGEEGAKAMPPDTAARADIDIEQWLDDLGWDTEFRSWNDQIASFGRDGSVADHRVGTVAARRR